MAHVTPADLTMILKMQFATQLSWVFALCFTRLSIAASLLRFESTRWWTYSLYFMMSLQCLITTAYFVIQLGQCRPISASWETIPDVQCWPMKPIINFGWAVSGMFGLRDILRPTLKLISCIYYHGPHAFTDAHPTNSQPLTFASGEGLHWVSDVARPACYRYSLCKDDYVPILRYRRRSAGDYLTFYIRNAGERGYDYRMLASLSEVNRGAQSQKARHIERTPTDATKLCERSKPIDCSRCRCTPAVWNWLFISFGKEYFAGRFGRFQIRYCAVVKFVCDRP